jgi:CBS domain-containing protein
MSAMVLSVGPDHSLRSVAQMMASRRVGAAVVEDHDGIGVGILTERDILIAIAAGEDADLETARAHLTPDIVYAAPEWTLEHAGQAMMRGGFRHLVVMEDGEVVGIVSMRDLVRVYLTSIDEG